MRVAEAQTIIHVPTTTRNGQIHKAMAHLTLAADLLKMAAAEHAWNKTKLALRLSTKALEYVERDEKVRL